MERLLNIKEAAEYLNVSEMTIRRWTNKGMLRCCRVGGRRARRFRRGDLEAFLEDGRAGDGPGEIALDSERISAPDGAHIIHLSTGDGDSLRTAVDYVGQGLHGGESVCIVVPGDKTENIVTALRRNGANVEKFNAAGRLHLTRGMDTPERHAAYLMDLARRAGGRFRVFGDMTWTRAKGWGPEDLWRLEKAVPSHAAGGLLLCQYPLDRFTGMEIMTAIEAHTHTLYRGQFRETPFSR